MGGDPLPGREIRAHPGDPPPWVRRAEVDSGRRPGITSGQQDRIRKLERENRELRRANEILKAASVFFAWELDPRLPKA
jgi:transposase